MTGDCTLTWKYHGKTWSENGDLRTQLHSSGAKVSWRLFSGVSHLHFLFLPLQLWAERSRQQIQGTDIWTDSWSGQFSTVAGSYCSLSSKTLMLLVSHFTSSGQRAKLTVLGCVPSLPFVCVYLMLSNPLPFITFTFLSLCYFPHILMKMTPRPVRLMLDIIPA